MAVNNFGIPDQVVASFRALVSLLTATALSKLQRA